MQSTHTTTAPKPEIQGARNVANIVHELWERTADRLTPSELEWFAGAAGHAGFAMRNLEDVIEGIGCLVSSDNRENASSVTGAFQNGGDTSVLLFFMVDAIRQIRALVAVSDEASSRLLNPELYLRPTQPDRPR